MTKAELIDALIGKATFVMQSHEDRTPVRSVLEGSALTGLSNFEKRWTRMYVMQVCRAAAEILVEVSEEAQRTLSENPGRGEYSGEDIPYMMEIYSLFYADDQYARGRKTWSIYRL